MAVLWPCCGRAVTVLCPCLDCVRVSTPSPSALLRPPDVEVENKPVTPTWTVMQERPACNSKAVSDSPTEIAFTWDAAAAEHGTARKW